MGKKIEPSIHKGISRLSCGQGIYFDGDTPCFEDVFPIISKESPNVVEGFVHIDLEFDAGGFPEWNMTFCPTAQMRGMIKETQYDIPKIKVAPPANDRPVSLSTCDEVRNAFQHHVMGERALLGYRLIGNRLDYLREPKELIESHLDEIITGIGLQIRDYLKSNREIDIDRYQQMSDLADMIMEAELSAFTFSIYMLPDVFKGMGNSYCVMPRITPFNPFNNFATDKYEKYAPEKIRSTFAQAMKKAKDVHGLKFQIEIETLPDEIRKLAAKFGKDGKHIPSQFKRHKNPPRKHRLNN